jgi:excisionase family DNA binding protein
MSAGGDDDALKSPCLTARQAAAYLHLNEKKLYELANTREIPAARIGGKWLFPRALLDDWLLEHAHGGALTDRLLITGADDALLRAATRTLADQLGAEAFVAYSPTTSLHGLDLLDHRRANIAALHWGDEAHSLPQHAALLRPHAGHAQWTLVRIALREQGVIMRRGLGMAQLETLAGFDLRWTMPTEGSGTRHFLQSSLAARGFHDEDCSIVSTALGEQDAAARLVRDEADCTPGTRATATEFGLDFLPLGWEALDLVLPREIVFRHLFQALLTTLAGNALHQHAQRLGGYDLTPLGRILTLP